MAACFLQDELQEEQRARKMEVTLAMVSLTEVGQYALPHQRGEGGIRPEYQEAGVLGGHLRYCQLWCVPPKLPEGLSASCLSPVCI